MVMVEPPETMRPLRHELPGGARKRERIDAVMRVEALVLVGDQHGEEARVDIVARAGRRQRPSGVVNGRSSLPSRSSTSVE